MRVASDGAGDGDGFVMNRGASQGEVDQLQDFRSQLWFRVPSSTLLLGAYMRSMPTLRDILVRPTRLDLESCLIDIANSGECSQAFFISGVLLCCGCVVRRRRLECEGRGIEVTGGEGSCRKVSMTTPSFSLSFPTAHSIGWADFSIVLSL